MAPRTPTCPSCSGDLSLTTEGDLDTWQCRSGHGEAMVLHEAHGQVQDDEISLLWARARETRDVVGPRACPMCTRGMSPIEMAYDSDEVAEGDHGDGADEGSVWLDVCEPCQVIWFDTHELTSLPKDAPNPQPSDSELEAVAQIRHDFGNSYATSVRERSDQELAERIARRLRLRRRR